MRTTALADLFPRFGYFFILFSPQTITVNVHERIKETHQKMR